MPKGIYQHSSNQGFQKGNRLSCLRLNTQHSEETKEKISLANKGKHYSPKTEFKNGTIPHNKYKKIPKISGKNHWNWKGGIFINDYNKWQRDRRKFRRETDENYRLVCKFNDNKKRTKRIIHLHIIQLVYEDNIKKYGALTCYLCLKEIQFGKDHLEHKIPLSRGGSNLYENLAVACQRCNCSKRSKTPEEFLSKMEDSYGTKIHSSIT